MKNSINVMMGHLHASKIKDEIIRTIVGSCVALCLYDDESKIGGLAHVVLPYRKNALLEDNRPAKYADQAIENLLEQMIELGAKKNKIKAKMAGGANMFYQENGTPTSQVGFLVVNSIRKILQYKQTILLSEDVGGNYARNILFHIDSGDVFALNRKVGGGRI